MNNAPASRRNALEMLDHFVVQRADEGRILAVGGILVAFLVFGTAIAIWPRSDIAVTITEVSGNSLAGSRVTIQMPIGVVKGHMSGRPRNGNASLRVFACLDGLCDSGSPVNSDGSWSIPHVAFRHPAENAGEAHLQVVLSETFQTGAAPEYHYSKTIDVSFPTPEISLDEVCDQNVATANGNLRACQSTRVGGKVKNLLWNHERVCVRIESIEGLIFAGPALIEEAAQEREGRAWSAISGKPALKNSIIATVGLDSTTTGACNLQSVLIDRRVFTMSATKSWR